MARDPARSWLQRRARTRGRFTGCCARCRASEYLRKTLQKTGPKLVKLANIPTLDSARDRKSTRLNSSHVKISYAVFCLKKKKLNIACIVRRALERPRR